MSKKMIVFHSDCHDGITALWAALKSPTWKDAEPYAGKHHELPDLARLRDADVLMVDFSWKRGPMAEIAACVKSVLVLDHHKTAEEELRGYNVLRDHVRAVFDMNRSGAGLAWDELVGGPRPWIVDYTEDRDLWKFALPMCREVHAAIDSYPLTLEWRSWLADEGQLGGNRLESLKQEGVAILRYQNKLVEGIAKNAKTTRIAGHDVPCVACPVELCSEVGHLLAKSAWFAATFIDLPTGERYFSLRSDEDKARVNEIAALFGGGGHPHAAGFTIRPHEVKYNTLAYGRQEQL